MSLHAESNLECKATESLAIYTQYNLFALAFLVIKTSTIGRDRRPINPDRRDIVLSSLIFSSPSKGYSRGLGYP